MAYTNVIGVRQYLDIADGGDDALFGDLIDAAQKAIDIYTRRTWEATADTTRYFDYSSENIDGLTLFLDKDLCSITTVTNGDSVVVASNERTTIPRIETPYYAIRLLSDSGVTWTYDDEWMDAISITGRWAYSTSAPNDIVQACNRLAAFYYKQRDQQMFDVTAIEAGTLISPVGLPADVRRILDPRVKPS
jgi:hypothetical protein